jgi:competence transcription factor ComK
MYYIIHTAFGCQIYQKDGSIKEYVSTFSYVKKLCMQHLFTYQGYIKACRKKLGFKYKIPIYINDCLQLIPLKSVRDYDNIWVNYAHIRSFEVHKEGLEIFFFDGTRIVLNISIKTFKTQIKRLNTIREVKVKHFHC